MTQRLSILAEIPLPPDLIDSRKIEGPFLEIAEKFRTEVNALAKKLKCEGVTFGTRVVKTKEAKKTAAPAAVEPAAAPAAPAPAASAPSGKPWAAGGTLAQQIAESE